MKINEIVKWLDCPGSISAFEVTRVRGLSPCGRWALVGWIRHPVSVDRLIPAVDTAGLYERYKPLDNQWGTDDVDKSTGSNLSAYTGAQKSG
jgi:hypothetical protein